MEPKELQNLIVNAGTVYLLMKDEHRISRNARAAWYFEHLNSAIKWPVDATQSKEEDGFEVLSMLASERPVFGLPTHYRVTEATRLVFLARHYRLVFVLDVSPSAASVDVPSSAVLYSEAFRHLQMTLTALVKPFGVEDSKLTLSPVLHVTVIAHTPLIHCQANQVLLQGCVVTADNVDSVLDLVQRGLEGLEKPLADSFAPLVALADVQPETDAPITWGLFDDAVAETAEGPDNTALMASPDICFVNMLRYAILALQLLPEYSAAGIVVITDGLVALPDPSLFDSLMTQLRHSAITCSFILNGSEFHHNLSFGHVPYTELLQFIAKATFGAYFAKLPVFDPVDITCSGMNTLHKALLTWSFERPLGTAHTYGRLGPLEGGGTLTARHHSGGLLLSDMVLGSAIPLLKKKHWENTLPINAMHVMSCRLREGYTFKSVKLKGQSQVEISMVLPWRDFAHVHYTMTAAWPLKTTQNQTKVEVTVEGTYDFLYDITCPQKKPIKSPYRAVLIRRYWQFIQGISDTDQLLVHLRSFGTNSNHYNVPDYLKQGIPLYSFSAHSKKPQVNVQLNKDNATQQFASFWKPVFMLDMHIWQKWMHTQSVSMLLEHDTPLGRYLNIASPNSKYQSVTCRQALLTVTDCLSELASFTLIDNHSYIKLLPGESADKPPISFYLIRLACKMPCLVIRLAFLAGTPGKLRHSEISFIKEKLANLNLPGKQEFKSASDGIDGVTAYRPPLQRIRAQTKSCVLVSKPIEKICIRYEQVPRDFSSVTCGGGSAGQGSANKVSTSLLLTLSRYLYHRRWVWSVQHGGCPVPVSMQAVGRILSTITKIRLQEGYHFGQTNLGIVNMMLEVRMKVPDDCEENSGAPADEPTTCPCIVQYVIFPPHTTTSRELAEDEAGEESAEADAELQIITECWVEPQYGQVIHSAPERRHYDGITYQQLPQAMYPVDLECISTMITFEHLNLMCHSKTVPSPSLHGTAENGDAGGGRFVAGSPVQSGVQQAPCEETCVQHVPFPFSLLRILPKCQQVELVFSTLLQDLNTVALPTAASHEDDTSTNHLLFTLFLDYLSTVHDREIKLTDSDCSSFIGLIRSRERPRESSALPFKYCHYSSGEEGSKSMGEGSRRGSTDSVMSQCSSQTTESLKVESLKKSQSQAVLHSSLRSYTNLVSSHSQDISMAEGSDSRSLQGSSSATLNMLQSSFNKASILSPHVQSPCEDVGERLSSIGARSFQAETNANDSALKEDTVPVHVPKWRCFIKALTSTHVMLTFVPASYQHLLLLSEGTAGLKDLWVLQQEQEGIRRQQEIYAQACKDEASARQGRGNAQQQQRSSQSSAGVMSEDVISSPRSTSSKIDEPQADSVLQVSETETREESVSQRPRSDNFEELTQADACPESQLTAAAEATAGQSDPETSRVPKQTIAAGQDSFVVSAKESTSTASTMAVSHPPQPSSHLMESAGSSTQASSSEKSKQCFEAEEREPLPCPELTRNERAIHLPVYVYNCPLSFLTEHLVNKWTYQRPRDYFEDLRFQLEEWSEREPGEGELSSEESERRRRRKTVSEGERRRLGEHGSENVYEDQPDLKQHCTMVSETYFRSFVNCVFKGIQEGLPVSGMDVEAAVNCICEESLPIEIDITKFVTTSCGHTRQVLERANQIALMHEDRKNAFMSHIICAPDGQEEFDVRKSDTSEYRDGGAGGGAGGEGTSEEKMSSDVPVTPEECEKPGPQVEGTRKNSLDREGEDFASLGNNLAESPVTPGDGKFLGTKREAVRFPLRLLGGCSPCEDETNKGLHELVKAKFSCLLSQCFKRVPSRPEFLIYQPPEAQQSQEVLGDETGETGNVDVSYDAEFSPRDHVLDGPDPLLDISCTNDGDSSRASSVKDEASVVGGPPSKLSPLFVHPMVTVRHKGAMLKSIPARNLPTCFSELKECFEDQGLEIDLSDIQVTLDLICLTLPPETDLAESTKRPCYVRMTSYTSQLSYHSTSSVSDSEDMISQPATTDFGSRFGEEVGSLPEQYQQAVAECRSDVEWLLRDEYVSAMRLLLPVTASTLHAVATHVHDAHDHATCLSRHHKLQFVYGTQHSYLHFIERFERLNLPKYHLNKEGSYYYLCLDKTYIASFAPPHVLTDRLTALTQQHSPGQPPTPRDAEEHDPPLHPDGQGLGTQVETCGQDGDVKAHTSTPQKSSVSKASRLASIPGSPDKTLVRQEAVDLRAGIAGEPQDELSARRNLTAIFSEGRKEGPGHTVESKETQTEDYDDHGERGSAWAGTLPAGEAQAQDDIRISVTRPSPVREVVPLTAHTDPTGCDHAESHEADSKRGRLDGGTASADGKNAGATAAGEGTTKTAADAMSRRTSESRSPGADTVRKSSETRSLGSEMLRQGSDEVFEQGILLPGSKMDAFSKSVHFLQHQSPSTHYLDSQQLRDKLKAEKLMEQRKEESATKASPAPLVLPADVSDSGSHSHHDVPIRRAHSSASFEKYKAEVEQRPAVRRSHSGRATPSRSRHQSGKSGLMTPISSVFDVSSRSSYGEEGYDGDSSDTEDGHSLMSFSDARVLRPMLPDFWLVLKVDTDSVHVYFHARDMGEPAAHGEHKALFERVIEHIKQVCHQVNQMLLLEDLHKTRMCNNLLVPEADEDVRWTQSVEPHRHKTSMQSDSDESDIDGNTNYLEASRHFRAGYFSCSEVWAMHFPLHPRLKSHRHDISIGISSLKMVLQNISVINRTNMFVYKENGTGNVFYLRLLEGHAGAMGPSETGPQCSMDEEASSSLRTFARSASMISISKHPLADDERTRPFDLDLDGGTADDKDVDSLSMSSRMTGISASTRGGKQRDSVSLVAYGITSVGAEISKDLVQALQKKLDDAVLDLMRDILTRNRMCKLMPEDVQFIQRAGTQPSATVYMTIPSSVMLQQYALGYYLRQNLLEFLFKPNFSSGESCFRDFTSTDMPPIPDSDVFLYNRPQQSSGKGLACIHLLFVDGRGRPLRLLGCPKPSPSCGEPAHEHLYEGLVDTQTCRLDESTPTQGPLVKFNIWERGDVGISQLTEKLRKAVQHALCDVITEYRLLTAPLCEIPQHYLRGVDSPLHSAPASPHNADGSQRALRPQASDMQDPALNKAKSAFSFQSIVSDFFRPSTSAGSTPKDPAKMGGADAESERERRSEEELLRQKLCQYELGERGMLHRVYSRSVFTWFQFCNSLGCAAVQKCSVALTNLFSLHYSLEELGRVVAEVTPDTCVKAFRAAGGASEHDAVYEPYNMQAIPSAPGLEEQHGSDVDLTQCGAASYPGRPGRYIVVCRNMEQWRNSLESKAGAGSRDLPAKTKGTGKKSLERFQALEEEKRGDVADSPSRQCGSVPRQRLLVISVSGKQMTLYAYNWASDAYSTVEKQLRRAVSWHNARSHLLTCMVSQKLGLFQHNVFSGPDEEGGLQSVGDIDHLVKCTSPAPAAPNTRGRAGSTNARQAAARLQLPSAPIFDGLYRDTKPSKPLQHDAKISGLRDPVHRHGAQMMELRSTEKQKGEKLSQLADVYFTWEQRGLAHHPISRDVLDLLKTSSRLVHSVGSPLLFSPAWRQKILGTRATKVHPAVTSLTKSRSRHGSGSSVKSRRSSGIESEPARRQQEGEEPWHVELRDDFLREYSEYICELGFTKVSVRPSAAAARRSGSFNLQRSSSNAEKREEEGRGRVKVAYLQKTLAAGIMLIELAFQDAHFCVHVYALDCTTIPRLSKSINPRLAVYFTDECDRFKDLTHVHSFTHDYHLRVLQAYTERTRRRALTPAYHVASFLSDFVKHFTHIPHFAINFVLQGALKVEQTSTAGLQLFQYITKHQGHHRMAPLEMSALPDDELQVDTEKEIALVTHYDCDVQVEPGGDSHTEQYRVGLVVTHDPPTGAKHFDVEKTSLHLKYWVIMTNKTSKFPFHKKLEKKLGTVKSAMAMYPTAKATGSSGYEEVSVTECSAPSTPPCRAFRPPLRQLIRKPHAIETLDYPPTHQTPVYEQLLQRSHCAKADIFKMVQITMAECRRDLLWQSMLLPSLSEEGAVGGRRKHRSGWVPANPAAVDEDRPQPSTFSEFEQLLGMVEKMPLSKIDDKLLPLQNMPIAWYSGLQKALINKFREAHRLYLSADQLIQYLVIVNHSCLDTFLMLSIDQIANKGEVSLVFKSLVTEEPQNPTTRLATYFSPPRLRHRTAEDRMASCGLLHVALDVPEAAGRSGVALGTACAPGGLRHGHGGVLQVLDSQPNLQNVWVQRLLRQFIDLCCFHLWSSMLQQS